jgi:hypothetical protein
MIKVAFRIEPHEDVYDHLKQWAGTMPWLEYLQTNCTDLSIESVYHPAPHLNEIVFRFDLPPKKETYYRLKYGDGTD